MRRITGLMLLAIVPSFPATAQGVDWLKLFADLTNTDPAISQAARSTSFEKVLPALETEDGALLAKDIAGIAPAFTQSDTIRLQASAVLSVLAMRRPDSAEVLKPAFPLFVQQFDDPTPRIRENAVRAAATLRPRVPPEFMSLLIDLTRDKTPAIAAIATYGVARSAGESKEALTALQALFGTAELPAVRRMAAEQAGWANAVQPGVIEELRKALADDDRVLAGKAIEALGRLGPAARAARPDLQRIANSASEEGLQSAAQSALARIGPN